MLDLPAFTPPVIGVVTASTGAVIAALAPATPLRRLFDNSVRAWIAGLVALGVLVAISVVIELRYGNRDELRYLLPWVLVYVGGLFWCAVGAVVLLTTPLRRRYRYLDRVVGALVVIAGFVGTGIGGWIVVDAVS
jgi:hypothetical protein